MSELVVAKAGGTSHRDAAAMELSLGWAEQSSIFVPSAPGRLGGWTKEAEQAAPNGVIAESKVTKMLLAAHAAYIKTGTVPGELTGMITDRYWTIVDGLGNRAEPSPLWIDDIRPRVQEAVRHGEHTASMLGERLQAEIYEALGFRLLDPGRVPHDLGSDPIAWEGWLSTAFDPAEKHVLIGNTTRKNGQLRTFGGGGSDITEGLGAYGIHAGLNLNLTDGCAMSADPGLVDRSRLKVIPHLLYKEGRELGKNGTGLVHPEAMVPLMRGNIPTQVRSTFDRNLPFTELDNDESRAQARAGRAVALSLMNDVVVHRIHEGGMAEPGGRLAAFDVALANAGISVIDSQGDGFDAQHYFVAGEDADQAALALRSATTGGTVETSAPMSLITVVGFHLRNRLLHNMFDLGLNSGLRSGDWQLQGYPLSPATHSLRIGIRPEDAEEVLSAMHRCFIEAPAP